MLVGFTYLYNLVASHKLVNIFPRSSVEQKTREINTAFPGLESAFVDIRADVGALEIGECGVVIS